MAEMEDRPLVTFALFAYNQERYIEEAVAGALAQDYSPLEIILSDDCSTDSTFEIMSRMATEYKGQHKIVLNRNERNLGIGGHVDKVLRLASSDLAIMAAGDDISIPKRTSTIVDKWLVSKRVSLAIFSSYISINSEGKRIPIKAQRCDLAHLNDLDAYALGMPSYLGATAAYDLRVIREFPPFIEGIKQEDAILPARAALLGKVDFIESDLILYRVGSGISTIRNIKININSVSNYHIGRYLLFRQKSIDFICKNKYDGRSSMFENSLLKEKFPYLLRNMPLTSIRRSDFSKLEINFIIKNIIRLVRDHIYNFFHL